MSKQEVGKVNLAALNDELQAEAREQGLDPANAALGAAPTLEPNEPRAPSVSRLKAVLAERKDTHGEFREHASIAQRLKDDMRACKGWERLSAIQREALEMNAHKVARILAGDPHFKDHWTDIAGYAQLVADRLV